MTLREAVWNPFLGFLSRHRALEILAFVFLYKIADNLADGLLRPFLFDKGYSTPSTAASRWRRSGWSASSAAPSSVACGPHVHGAGSGALVLRLPADLLQPRLRLRGPVGEPTSSLMYGCPVASRSSPQGLGTGAFSVLLLRMTQKRFSATQYALFSSLFALPRIVAGPDRRLHRRRGRMGSLLLVHHLCRYSRPPPAPALLALGRARSALRGRTAAQS